MPHQQVFWLLSKLQSQYGRLRGLEEVHAEANQRRAFKGVPRSSSTRNSLAAPRSRTDSAFNNHHWSHDYSGNLLAYLGAPLLHNKSVSTNSSFEERTLLARQIDESGKSLWVSLPYASSKGSKSHTSYRILYNGKVGGCARIWLTYAWGKCYGNTHHNSKTFPMRKAVRQGPQSHSLQTKIFSSWKVMGQSLWSHSSQQQKNLSYVEEGRARVMLTLITTKKNFPPEKAVGQRLRSYSSQPKNNSYGKGGRKFSTISINIAKIPLLWEGRQARSKGSKHYSSRCILWFPFDFWKSFFREVLTFQGYEK